MSRAAPLPTPGAVGDAIRPPVPFGAVLCGVGPGTPSLEAAAQAAVLASGGEVTLVAIGGGGAVGPEWAELAAAFVLAARDGELPEVLEVPADRVLPALLLLAGLYDLLAIGAHDAGSQREDITRTIVRQSPVPVLVARASSGGAQVTDRILVALVAPGDPVPPIAAAIAQRHGSTVEMVAIPAAPRDHAARVVLDAAGRFGATLVVVSSGGLTGVPALESVSAAVAAQAGCSVLVLRDP